MFRVDAFGWFDQDARSERPRKGPGARRARPPEIVLAPAFDNNIHGQTSGILPRDAHHPRKAQERLQVKLTASLFRGTESESPMSRVVS